MTLREIILIEDIASDLIVEFEELFDTVRLDEAAITDQKKIDDCKKKYRMKDKKANNIVLDWACKFGLKYEDVHKVWERAEEKAGKGNYGLIVHIFKRMFTSIKGVDARRVKTVTGGNFNYKVRTKQDIEAAKTDEKPKLTPAAKKRLRVKIKKLTDQIKDLKSKNQTPLRKERIKKLLAQKKELQTQLKEG